MTQRTMAGLLALVLLVGLWAYALTTPVRYVTYHPGLTVDVLGEGDRGDEIVQINGQKTYRDGGQLRMTTVYRTQPEAEVNIFEAMEAWLDPDAALYPYDAVYRPDETKEEAETESAVMMVSSQDSATAVALRELGHEVKQVVEVLNVGTDVPAEGKLKVRDIIRAVNGKTITSSQDIVDIVEATKPGESLTFSITRKKIDNDVRVTPKLIDGKPRVGITPGPGFEFPFDVTVGIDPTIGGPSAGLLFSLAIYDTLTPGSLTGDAIVAGTGTIDSDGKVGPIGGIQQKIAASRDADAALFLVPPDNCADVVGLDDPGLRLVRAETMHKAVKAIKAWVEDHDAKLPTCEK